MDELEGLVKPRDLDPEDARSIEGSNKRAQIEDGSANGNGSTSSDADTSNKKAKTTASAAPPSQAKGLLSGSALDSLKKAAALRKLKAQKAAASSTAAK